MALTYSLSITGVSAGQHLDATDLKADDATFGTLGLQLQAARLGTTSPSSAFSGANNFRKIDADRWTATVGPLAGIPGYGSGAGISGLIYRNESRIASPNQGG